MDTVWQYRSRTGARTGSCSLGQLDQLVADGQVEWTDFVRPDGTEVWVLARDVSGLFSAPDAPAPAMKELPATELVAMGSTAPVAAAEPVGPAGMIPVAVPVTHDRNTPAVAIPVGANPASGFEAVLAGWRKLLPHQQRWALGGAGAGLLFLVVLVVVAIPRGNSTSVRPLIAQANARPTAGGQPVTVGQPAAQPVSAQPVTAQPPANTLDPRLIGTWHLESFSSAGSGDFVLNLASHNWVTITADGRFTDKSVVVSSFADGTGETGETKSGQVTQQGGTLTFREDRGTAWTASVQFGGPNAIRLNGSDWYFK